MGLAITVDAAFDVVSLNDVKQFGNIVDDDSDSLISRNLATAIEDLEATTWRTFAQKTYTWTFDRWPEGGIIRVPRPPLQSVTSIKYYDAAGTQQTIASSAYRVAATSSPGRIDEADGSVWPVTDGRPDGIEIVYVAGYASSTAIPNRIKTLVCSVAADLFYCRDPQGQQQVFANPAHVRMIRNVRVNDFEGWRE